MKGKEEPSVRNKVLFVQENGSDEYMRKLCDRLFRDLAGVSKLSLMRVVGASDTNLIAAIFGDSLLAVVSDIPFASSEGRLNEVEGEGTATRVSVADSVKRVFIVNNQAALPKSLAKGIALEAVFEDEFEFALDFVKRELGLVKK